MKKNSTLFSPCESSVEVHVELNHRKSEESAMPKAATLERIRQFARVAFSDSALVGMPALILN